jgi:hypothetical protein
MTPAEELRAAATKLRETASKATPGPWEIRDGNKVSSNVVSREDMVIDGGGWTDGTKAVVYGAALTADAVWIALASPALAEPLAAWLEGITARHNLSPDFDDRDECIWCAEPWPCPDLRDALAVARAINGDPR